MSVRGEAQLRMALGVEEVGRLEVGGEVFVLHVDARDLGDACERRAVAVDGELARRSRGTRP